MTQTKIETKIELNVKISIELSIDEARAIHAMVGYGVKPFLEGYYKHLGKSYMQPHEKGITSFFETAKTDLGHKLHDLDKVIEKVSGLKEQIKLKP